MASFRTAGLHNWGTENFCSFKLPVAAVCCAARGHSLTALHRLDPAAAHAWTPAVPGLGGAASHPWGGRSGPLGPFTLGQNRKATAEGAGPGDSSSWGSAPRRVPRL